MKWAAQLGVACACLLGACRGQQMALVGDMTCANLDTSCPATPPSFATDVFPVIQSTCNGCHVPNGAASDRLLTTYAQVFKLKGSAFTSVYSCVMPPADDTVDQLTPEQRTTILQWITCGAPDN